MQPVRAGHTAEADIRHHQPLAGQRVGLDFRRHGGGQQIHARRCFRQQGLQGNRGAHLPVGDRCDFDRAVPDLFAGGVVDSADIPVPDAVADLTDPPRQVAIDNPQQAQIRLIEIHRHQRHPGIVQARQDVGFLGKRQKRRPLAERHLLGGVGFEPAAIRPRQAGAEDQCCGFAVAQPLDAQGLALREHRQRTRRRDADIVAVIDRAASNEINGKAGADAGSILPGLRIDPHHGKQFACCQINLPLGGRIGGEALRLLPGGQRQIGAVFGLEDIGNQAQGFGLGLGIVGGAVRLPPQPQGVAWVLILAAPVGERQPQGGLAERQRLFAGLDGAQQLAALCRRQRLLAQGSRIRADRHLGCAFERRHIVRLPLIQIGQRL